MDKKSSKAGLPLRPGLYTPARVGKASVLPMHATGKTPEESMRWALLKRFEELEFLIGVDALRNKNLSKAELTAVAERLDVALEGVSGVSPRDRTLAWLYDAVDEVAAEMKWDLADPKSVPTVTLRLFARFCAGMGEHFPRLRGTKVTDLPDGSKADVIEFALLGPALAAAAAASPLRPDRPRGKRSRTPEKWLAFRNLAQGLKLEVPAQPSSLKRTVFNAKNRLSKLRNPLDKG